jgi:hypothetical protein
VLSPTKPQKLKFSPKLSLYYIWGITHLTLCISNMQTQIIDLQLDEKFDFMNLNETGYMFDMLAKARKLIKMEKKDLLIL